MDIEQMAKQKRPGEFDFDPQVEHNFSDGVYAKQMRFPAGAMVMGHKHNYSHLSILAQGSVMLRLGDEEAQKYTAPACIEIKAGTHHAIFALEETVWYCVHATDVADPEKVDNVLIQKDGETGG